MEKQNLNLEDIKVGEMYNVLMQVSDYADGIIFCSTVIGIDPKDGVQCGEEYEICHDEISAFSPISPSNDIKNTQTAPKYDPCRKFRKGDIVRHVPHNGRECPAMPLDEYYRVKTLTVVEDEDANHNVFVETQDGRNKYIRFCFLELVTPVEEIEPYSVSEATVQYLVKEDNKKVVAQFCKLHHPNAKAAAEAERDRLNAEYRKEQE